MKIIFKSIHIENLLSIGEADVNLNNEGYTLIRGINDNPQDGASSNGSGKTSIIEAIDFSRSSEYFFIFFHL